MNSVPPNHNQPWRGWPWVTAGVVAGTCLLLGTCLAGYVYLAVTGAKVDRIPRVLPNHYTLETINGDWTDICWYGSIVDLDGAVPGAFAPSISQLAVADPYVFGTVYDAGANAPERDGYFIFNTKNGAKQTFTEEQPWRDALTALGLNPDTPLVDPLSLPKVH